MKNKFVITTFLSAFLLVAPNVKAANFADNQTVDLNKIWTIKFTDEVRIDDLKNQGITVTDSKGNTVNVAIQLDEDSKTVKVAAPEDGYTVGENYILNVGTRVHSKRGKALKNQCRIHFNVKSNDNIVTFKDKNLEQVIRDTIKKLPTKC